MTAPTDEPRSRRRLRAVRDEPDEASWTERVKAAYESSRAPLWRALVAWGGSPDVAEEAIAESFAQLLRRGEDVRDPAAWAWRSAFRIAAGDLQRRRTRLVRSLDDDHLEALPADATRLSEEAIDLVGAMAQLSDQQRRCVALVDIAGHDAPAAARILDTSAATVRVQLMRARRHLRALLTDSPDSEETNR